MPPRVTALRARRDGHEPAAAEQQAIQRLKRHAGLGPQHAGLLVEGQQAVGRRGVGHDEAGAAGSEESP